MKQLTNFSLKNLANFRNSCEVFPIHNIPTQDLSGCPYLDGGKLVMPNARVHNSTWAHIAFICAGRYKSGIIDKTYINKLISKLFVC